jgi:hypothetical protein
VKSQDNAFIVTLFVLSDLVTFSTNRLVHNAWLAHMLPAENTTEGNSRLNSIGALSMIRSNLVNFSATRGGLRPSSQSLAQLPRSWLDALSLKGLHLCRLNKPKLVRATRLWRAGSLCDSVFTPVMLPSTAFPTFPRLPVFKLLG